MGGEQEVGERDREPRRERIDHPISVLLGRLADAAFLINLSPRGSRIPRGGLSEIAPARVSGKAALQTSASDARGYVYALTELADRVRHGSSPDASLSLAKPVEEQPANTVRSIARAFVSDVEDKPWFYDKGFWRDYLTALVTNRFNRFSLTFGLGYDFPRNVVGDYMHFAYPYFVDVPGYKVRAVPLDDAERDRNFEMLRFIVEETATRGLEFQLGLWTHAYEWTDSPRAGSTTSKDSHPKHMRPIAGMLSP